MTAELDRLPRFRTPHTTSSNCLGCAHYHGFVYFGQPLVCTLHLAGWDWQRSTCPDRQSINPT